MSVSLTFHSSLFYPALKFTFWNEHLEDLCASICSYPVLLQEAAQAFGLNHTDKPALPPSLLLLLILFLCVTAQVCVLWKLPEMSGPRQRFSVVLWEVLCDGGRNFIVEVGLHVRIASLTTAWKTSPLFIRDPIHQSPLTLTTDNVATQTFVNYPPYFIPGTEVTEEQVLLSPHHSARKDACLCMDRVI